MQFSWQNASSLQTKLWWANETEAWAAATNAAILLNIIHKRDRVERIFPFCDVLCTFYQAVATYTFSHSTHTHTHTVVQCTLYIFGLQAHPAYVLIRLCIICIVSRVLNCRQCFDISLGDAFFSISPFSNFFPFLALHECVCVNARCHLILIFCIFLF